MHARRGRGDGCDGADVQEVIPTALMKHQSQEASSRAVKMFARVLKYMGETHEEVSHEAAIELAQKLLHQALKSPHLRDELYMQLVKQTRGNPNVSTKLRAWELLYLVCATVPPSTILSNMVLQYLLVRSLSNAVLQYPLASLQRSASPSSASQCLSQHGGFQRGAYELPAQRRDMHVA
jgi:hypothetical protein